MITENAQEVNRGIYICICICVYLSTFIIYNLFKCNFVTLLRQLFYMLFIDRNMVHMYEDSGYRNRIDNNLDATKNATEESYLYVSVTFQISL